jgi:uncharacterized OsmC-like protein
MKTLIVEAIHAGGMRVAVQAGAHAIAVDYPSPGHEAGAPTSLELLLAALASCAANTLAALLGRDGIVPASLAVGATALRRETHPTVLESIHLDFQLSGTALDPDTIERALLLAETRLCPVWAMLAPGTRITRALELVPGVVNTNTMLALSAFEQK